MFILRMFVLVTFINVLFVFPLYPSKGLVVFVKGKSNLIRNNVSSVIKMHTLVQEGDTVTTENNSYVHIQLSNGVILRVGENTRVTFRKLLKSNQSEEYKLKLEEGEILTRINREKNKQKTYQVQTPTAVASVRGTELYIKAGLTETLIAVKQGIVEVLSLDERKKEILRSGEKMLITLEKQKKQLLDEFEKQKFRMLKELEETRKDALDSLIQKIEEGKNFLEEQKKKIPALR